MSASEFARRFVAAIVPRREFVRQRLAAVIPPEGDGRQFDGVVAVEEGEETFGCAAGFGFARGKFKTDFGTDGIRSPCSSRRTLRPQSPSDRRAADARNDMLTV